MIRICANDDCKKKFTPNAHNQKYCSDQCCTEVTNERIRRKYYRDKAIKEGLKRVCLRPGCETVLSRYNLEDECSVCQRREEQMDQTILRMLE